jgi:hypothetical protein
VHCAKSDLLLLSSDEEKGTSNFSPNSPLEHLFAKNANRSKNASSLAHHASTTKTKLLRIRHTMATLILAQHNYTAGG